MKTYLLLFLMVILNVTVIAQHICREEYPAAQSNIQLNQVGGTISTGGDLFFGEPYWGETGFGFHADDTTFHYTIYLATLIMSGIDTDGKYRSAYQTYGRSSGHAAYVAGPLPTNGISDSITRCNWDKIWKVSAESIYLHNQEIATNGTPLIKRKEIYDYPAKGNPYFADYNEFSLPTDSELAPFFDKNNNGRYDPDTGEYPLPRGVHPTAIPDSLYWSIFNDDSERNNRDLRSEPLRMEIGFTAFAYNCPSEPAVDRSLFTQYTVTNKGGTLDSFRIGTYFNMNIGFWDDDSFGTAPEINTAYVYNRTPEDDFKAPFLPHISGSNLPVQSFTYLNRSLDHSLIHWEPSLSCCYVGRTGPGVPFELHHNMSGRWKDGLPLTYGGSGRETSDTIMAHSFPDNPNDSTGWSMPRHPPSMDIRGITAHRKEQFVASETIFFDKAWTYHQAENGNHLSNVNYMYEQIPRLQQYYDNGFANLPCLVSSTEHIDNQAVMAIFPNPTTGGIQIDLPDLEVSKIRLFNSQGTIILTTQQTDLDISPQPAGVYFLKIEMKSGELITRKIIKL